MSLAASFVTTLILTIAIFWSRSPPIADAAYTEDGAPVACGSLVKLVNEGARLHSHEVKYGSGSGQQSVTAVTNADDVNSHWQILAPLGATCHRGAPVKCGAKIRLLHLTTGCYLHSHSFPAPIAKNLQEVSCFGGPQQSDTGDEWTVLCEDSSSDIWSMSDRVRFRHADTQHFLVLSGNQYGRPIQGQREVAAALGSTGQQYWKTAEGIYMMSSDDE